MEGYGERMQYSVFRCWMTRREMERLRWELTELLAPEDDVLLIPLCGSCVAGIVGIHGRDARPDWPEAAPAARDRLTRSNSSTWMFATVRIAVTARKHVPWYRVVVL